MTGVINDSDPEAVESKRGTRQRRREREERKEGEKELKVVD